MPLKKLKEFTVEYLQILDKDGNCDEKLKPELKDADLKKMYELMVLARTFDDKALNLQRQGRMGTYGAVRGQEACQIGSAIQLEKKDWMFIAFREHAACIVRNIPMRMIFQYWGGDERGSFMPTETNSLPVVIGVGLHLPHAVGAAWACKLKKEKNIAIVYFGDGATSKGDFHEAMNFAGMFKVPLVFICQNNQWAISVPRKKQTAAETIAQKAIAYGFPGIQVDGNDVFAVYKATKDAIERARKGEGPTLIECFTYRMGDHTTSDDAKRYRDPKEVEYWKERDPIDRLAKYMKGKGIWNEKYAEEIKKSSTLQVERAVEEYETFPSPKPEDVFDYVFKELPQNLKEQKGELLEFLKEHNKETEEA